MSQSNIDSVVYSVARNFGKNEVPAQMGIDILKLTLDNDAVISEVNPDTAVQMRADFIEYGNNLIALLEEQGCSREDVLAGLLELQQDAEALLAKAGTDDTIH